MTTSLARRALRRAFSAHVRVAVVRWRDEDLLDGPGVDPADQVEDRARLVIGAAGPGAPERLLADDRPGRLVVDVKIARREPQRVRRLRDRRPLLGHARARGRVRSDLRGLGPAPGGLRVIHDGDANSLAPV